MAGVDPTIQSHALQQQAGQSLFRSSIYQSIVGIKFHHQSYHSDRSVHHYHNNFSIFLPPSNAVLGLHRDCTTQMTALLPLNGRLQDTAIDISTRASDEVAHSEPNTITSVSRAQNSTLHHCDSTNTKPKLQPWKTLQTLWRGWKTEKKSQEQK